MVPRQETYKVPTNRKGGKPVAEYANLQGAPAHRHPREHRTRIMAETVEMEILRAQMEELRDRLETLIQLQKQLKGVAKQNFEFRNTRNGTRVVTKDMVDYQAVKSHFDKNSLSYYTFSTKAEKPIKAVLQHLPSNTPAQDIFDVISVRCHPLVGPLMLPNPLPCHCSLLPS
jgi:hypothetical protein